MTALAWLKVVHETCYFTSRERTGVASNSELRRWLSNGAVRVNRERVGPDEEMAFPLTSVVLFPSGNTVTLYEA